jgi:hypothetical protein
MAFSVTYRVAAERGTPDGPTTELILQKTYQ